MLCDILLYQNIWFLGHENIAKLLMENNADLNAKDDYGETPLHKCAEYGKRAFLSNFTRNWYRAANG